MSKLRWDHVSWGTVPSRDYRLHRQDEEIELIREWQEWNSDLQVGRNIINSNVGSSRTLGYNIEKQCAKAMENICKQLEDIRNERKELSCGD